jgi:hypothetical protein
MTTELRTPTARTLLPATTPSWRWAVRRAGFGLTVMLGVTALAAYVAYASIDPVTAEPEAAAASIAIGAPAAALLDRR